MVQPVAGTGAAVAGLATGMAADQDCGTDSVPTALACPTAAEAAAPGAPRPAPKPCPSPFPIPCSPMPATPRPGSIGVKGSIAPRPKGSPAAMAAPRSTAMSAPAWVIPASDMGLAELLIKFDIMFEASPGLRPSGARSASASEPGVVDCTGDVSPCRVGGTVEIIWDSVDCVPVAAAEAAVAAPWLLCAAGFVACGGVVNGVTLVAEAAAPA